MKNPGKIFSLKCDLNRGPPRPQADVKTTTPWRPQTSAMVCFALMIFLLHILFNYIFDLWMPLKFGIKNLSDQINCNFTFNNAIVDIDNFCLGVSFTKQTMFASIISSMEYIHYFINKSLEIVFFC